MATLIEKQKEMKSRHRKQKPAGRPPRTIPLEILEKGRRRFIAYLMLEKGLTPEHVAAELGVKVDGVRRWVAAGCPLR